MFNDMDTPKIGKKHIRGSCPRYKKLFCLHCMVPYLNDSLHICQGRCHRCLECIDDHTSMIVVDIFLRSFVMRVIKPESSLENLVVIVLFYAHYVTVANADRTFL